MLTIPGPGQFFFIIFLTSVFKKNRQAIGQTINLLLEDLFVHSDRIKPQLIKRDRCRQYPAIRSTYISPVRSNLYRTGRHIRRRHRTPFFPLYSHHYNSFGYNQTTAQDNYNIHNNSPPRYVIFNCHFYLLYNFTGGSLLSSSVNFSSFIRFITSDCFRISINSAASDIDSNLRSLTSFSRACLSR